MARKGNSASHHFMKLNSTLAAPSKFSFHFFYQNPHTPQANDKRVFTIANATESTCDFGFAWDNPSTPIAVFNKDSGGYKILSLTGSFSANTWYGIGGVQGSTTLSGYVNGSFNGSGSSGAPVAEAAATLSLLAGATGLTEWDDGVLAEVGYWNIDLSASEMAALGAGVSPLMIRPASLVMYAPLISDVVGLVGGAMSVTGTTQFPHPRVYTGDMVSARRFTTPAPQAFSNNVTFHSVMTGQILGVDGWQNNVNFQSLFQNVIQVSNNVNFASLFGVSPQLTNNVNFQSKMLNLDDYQSLRNQIKFKSTFKGDVGAIATGRFRGWFYG